MSFPISESLARSMFEFYRRSLYRRPVLTMLVSIIGALGLFTAGYFDKRQRELELAKRRESFTTYDQQVTQLNEVQNSLKNLSEFVSEQRTKLQESELTISKLQQEQQRMEPLVKEKREIVDAIFQLQEQRTSANVGKERWIGFGLGVGASLVASIIWSIIVKLSKRSPRIA